MENTEGSINVFVSGVLPKEKYSDVNELARDIASVLRIDQDRIVVDLIALESLKGEPGATGPRGIQGIQGPSGPAGASGPPGSIELNSYVILLPTGLVFFWAAIPSIAHQHAALILTGVNTIVITGVVNGMSGTLVVHNILVGGGGTLAFPSNSRFPGGTVPVVTPAAAGLDIFEWRYYGDYFHWTVHQNFLP